jgi:integrase
MPLSAAAVRNAKPRKKQFKLYDEKGLFLIVTPSGGKWWRFRYSLGGKEKLLSLGTYPETSLKDAREARDQARKALADGLDPSLARKIMRNAGDGDTFVDLAREWHAKFSSTWTERGARDVWSRLEKNVLPWLGHRPVQELTAPEILQVVRRIESRGALETARRQLQKIGQVMRYAVATGRAERDPAADLKGAIPPPVPKHHASVTDPRELAGLLRAIDGYTGTHVVRCALRLAPLTFVRPGELRHAEWSEFFLEDEPPYWKIPAEKMKMKRPHLVPLSRQAVAILEDLRPLTGNDKYLFPSVRTASRPMSENTVNAALRRMGFSKDEATGHGFRSTASTLLNEMGWPGDVIELQLAHLEKSRSRAAYNYAEHLEQRRKMMQAWADYLDDRKGAGRVLPIHKAG